MLFNDKLKKKIEENKILVQNCGWLYVIQIANYIFPLLTVPYLLRILDVEKYGLIAIAQSLTAYLCIIVDYGFNFTATRKIAMYKNNLEKRKEEFNNVFNCKIFLLVICSGLFIGTIQCLQISQEVKIFYLCAFTIVIGQVFFPVWFFQGIEDMKYITLINLMVRITYLILLFLFVKVSSDYIKVILFQGVSGIISSMVAMIIIKNKYKVTIYKIVSMNDLRRMLIEGKTIFIANACGNIYSQGSVLIVGFFSGQASAAYFSLGQKISRLLVSLVNPFLQAIYPQFCRNYKENKKVFFIKFKGLAKFFLVSNFILCLLLMASASYISLLLQGRIEEELVWIIYLFTIVTFGTFLNVLLHSSVLAMGKYSLIQDIYIKISILFLVLSVPLVYQYGNLGMVINLIIVEFYICFKYIKIIQVENKKLLA